MKLDYQIMQKAIILTLVAITATLLSCGEEKTRSGMVASRRNVVLDYKMAADTIEFVLSSKAVKSISEQPWDNEKKDQLRMLVYDCHAQLFKHDEYSMFGLDGKQNRKFSRELFFDYKTVDLTANIKDQFMSIAGSGEELVADPYCLNNEKNIQQIRYSIAIVRYFDFLLRMHSDRIDIVNPVRDQLYKNLSWVFAGLSHIGMNSDNSFIYGRLVNELDDETYKSVLNISSLAANYGERSKTVWGKESEFLSYSVFGYETMDSVKDLEKIFLKSIGDLKSARRKKQRGQQLSLE